MHNEGKSMLDVELTQELFKPPAIKLSTIVYNDGSREAITTYYGFLDERLCLKFGDVGHGLGLDPFGEVIYRNEEKFSL